MTALAPIAGIEGVGLALRRIMVSADPDAVARVAAAAAALGWPNPETASSIAAAVTAIAHGSPPALLIVDLDDETDPIGALASLACVCLPNTSVLACGSTNDVGLYRSLLVEGVGDYLVKPLQTEALTPALDWLTGVAAAAAPAADGRSIAVIGVRGGCGATTVATSLAWSISVDTSADRCVLIDFDLHYGTAAMTMAIPDNSGLAAMLASPDRLDEQMIAASLQPANPRLGVIAGQTLVEQDAAIAPEAALALVAALRTTAQWVVADLPRGLGPAVRQLLRTADTVVLVAPPSLEGLRDTGRLLTYMLALRAGAVPLVVVNGSAGGAGEISRKLFEDSIETPIAAWIPALWEASAAATANAEPLAACLRKGAENPFAALAAQVTGRAPHPPKSRWWRR